MKSNQQIMEIVEQAYKERKLQFFNKLQMETEPSKRCIFPTDNQGYKSPIGLALMDMTDVELRVMSTIASVAEDPDFLVDLESIHDNALFSVSEAAAKKLFKEGLTGLKKQYNLQ